MFSVLDPRPNRKRYTRYGSLTEALEAINEFGLTAVTDIQGTVRDFSFVYRQKFTYDGKWIMFRGQKYPHLRNLIRRLSSHATLTKLRVTFSDGSAQPIKLRLTSPMFASDLYE